MAVGEFKVRVSAEKLVDGFGGAGKFGIVIIVDNDNSLWRELGQNKVERSFNRRI